MPEELRFDAVPDGQCGATFYRPTGGSGTAPCVVLGNGLSMTRRDGVPRFAQHFAEAGIASLAFDFRHLGDSDGEPRQLIDFERQQADFRAAVSFARSLDGIDPSRIAVWGFSLGGGIALATALADETIATVILLCPMVDGLAFMLAGDVRNNVRGFGRTVGGLVSGQKPRFALTGAPGQTVVFTQDEAAPGFAKVKGERSLWQSEILLEPTRPAPRFRPGRRVGRLRAPLLVCLGTKDTIVPANPIVKVATRAQAGELRRFSVNHFDGFLGGFEQIALDQTEFLTHHLGDTAA